MCAVFHSIHTHLLRVHTRGRSFMRGHPEDMSKFHSMCSTEGHNLRGGLKIFDVTVKDCGAAESLTGSLNFGIFRTFLNGNFCTTDLCNSQTVPESNNSNSTSNGKQCFICKGQDCLNPINCLGDENSCVSMIADISGQKSFLKGCASKSMCGSISAQLIQLPGMSFTLDCCEGNLCNNARSLDTQASSKFLLSSKENKPMRKKQEL
ncbi:uncharacterized protein LOC124479733 [Hypomesus transpacificus]|uniref:uncharacterized protein LOC124479733 n=1 Tax=Hypomesus transpacificus TaxID=137520 RepID=UPI001F0755A0|nr:uncharacterized protein LOC124479733 [Hypomesus transpacificus]